MTRRSAPEAPGIPGAATVHHVAYTVPDLDQAVEFFTEVILAPVQDSEGDWMTRKLGMAATHLTIHVADVHTAVAHRRKQPGAGILGEPEATAEQADR